jgi:hypothetical protein
MDTQQNPNEPGKSPSPGQQGGQQQDRERERERSVNVSSASVKNKVAVNRAAANRADDKTGSFERTSGGRYLPPLFLRPNALLKAKPFCYARRRTNRTRARG